MAEPSSAPGLSWRELAQRGALTGAAAVGAAIATWYLIMLVVAIGLPLLIFLAFLAHIAALGAGVLAGLVTARRQGLPRPELVAIGGCAATVLGLRLGLMSEGEPDDMVLLWLAALPGGAVAFALAAVLAAPHRSRLWWPARAVVVAMVAALVPLAPAVADGRKIAGREAKFEALPVPLIMVELPGYRVTNATVRPDLPDSKPEVLELLLTPDAPDQGWKRRITVSVYRAVGPVDCAVLIGVPDRYATWGRTCRAEEGGRMVLPGKGEPVVAVVGEGAVAMLWLTNGSDLTSADLLPASVRPSSASELAALKR